MVDIPAFQRGGDVERKLQIERVHGDAVGPILRRQAAQDEAERQRHEEAGRQAAGELQREQHRQAAGERSDGRDHREGARGAQQRTARSVGGAHPDRHRRDQHLRHGLRGGDPGALVEAGVHGAADVGQAEGREPPVQGRDEGAEQHRRQAQPGDRRRVGGGRAGRQGSCGGVAHGLPSCASIRATTDMPGFRRSARPSASSMAIFTAMRCTTLVKLPVAIVRRQQGELGARRRREGLHVALQHVAGKGIDPHLRLLADRHVGQLGFLVVGDHPDARQRRQRGELAADPDILARPDLPLAQHAVHRRDHAGVAKVDLRRTQIGRLGGDRGLRLSLLGHQHLDLQRRGVGLGPVLRELRGQLVTPCRQLLRRLGRRRARRQQAALAGGVAAILRQGRGGGRNDRPGGLDVGRLQRLLGFEGLRLGLRGGKVRRGLGDRGAIVVVDDLGDQLAGPHPVEILHRTART